MPVITLVLNLSNTRWNNYKSLAEITKVPPEFKPHFQDYKVKVVDVAYLDNSVIDRFTSDFKLIARFFKNRRLGVEAWDDRIQIQHVEAFVDFIAAFANDARYQNVKEDLEKIKTKGEKVSIFKTRNNFLSLSLANARQLPRQREPSGQSGRPVPTLFKFTLGRICRDRSRCDSVTARL